MNVTDLSSASWGGNEINAVSGASGYVPTAASTSDPVVSQVRRDIQQNSQDFRDLKGALHANDLNAATQAFSALEQNIQTASQAAGGKSPFDSNSPIGKDFQAVGTALKSGDLSAAKAAFATFKQDIKRAGRAARAEQTQAGGAGATTSAGNSGSPSVTSGGLLDLTA